MARLPRLAVSLLLFVQSPIVDDGTPELLESGEFNVGQVPGPVRTRSTADLHGNVLAIEEQLFRALYFYYADAFAFVGNRFLRHRRGPHIFSQAIRSQDSL